MGGKGTIRCQIFQWFPMIFNGNFEEGENFFEGGTIRYFFWNQKIFFEGAQLEGGHKMIEYGNLIKTMFLLGFYFLIEINEMKK